MRELARDWAIFAELAVLAEEDGLHAHQLVRCTNPEQFALLAQRMGELRDEFTATSGANLETLDLGGGIEARYLLERAGHTIDDFADAARDALGGARSNSRPAGRWRECRFRRHRS